MYSSFEKINKCKSIFNNCRLRLKKTICIIFIKLITINYWFKTENKDNSIRTTQTIQNWYNCKSIRWCLFSWIQPLIGSKVWFGQTFSSSDCLFFVMFQSHLWLNFLLAKKWWNGHLIQFSASIPVTSSRNTNRLFIQIDRNTSRFENQKYKSTVYTRELVWSSPWNRLVAVFNRRLRRRESPSLTADSVAADEDDWLPKIKQEPSPSLKSNKTHL